MPSDFSRARRPRHVSRHAAAAVRRAPRVPRLAARALALKGTVAAGLAAGICAVLLTPPPAAPATAALTSAPSAGLTGHLAAARAARSARRTSPSAQPAISAPVGTAPMSRPSVGISGFRAVPAAPSRPATARPGTATARPVTATARPGAYDGLRYAAAARLIGLGPHAAVVYSAVRSAFGITNIGGYRAGDTGDHGTGHACDIMITSQAQGDAVASFVMARAIEFHVTYVIWRQRIWFPGATAWRPMADRGSLTANHYDHVHVSVS